MKTIIYISAIGLSMLLAGCGDDVPTSDEYRGMLQKRTSSVNGANINVKMEVDKYEASDDATKKALYDNVERLTR